MKKKDKKKIIKFFDKMKKKVEREEKEAEEIYQKELGELENWIAENPYKYKIIKDIIKYEQIKRFANF